MTESRRTAPQVTFSMMEIYNEKIRDLLNPDPKTNNDLKVRTTPKGTFVEGTKAKAVNSFEEIDRTMEAGTASRTVAATQMNATSSRAHTIMAIKVAQLTTEDGRTKEISSDMNLIDLAGSERAESTGATGDRLKEGAAINKSLSSLGNVISALADQANNPKKKVFIPYRDSKLTQILQSALGGNSKTIMVAALSPADINYEETLGTLRYADRAKQIKVVVEVQENATDKLIRQLKEENEKLKKMLEGMDGGGDLSALLAASSSGGDGGGGGGGGGGEGTITEEQMQKAIADAVAQVKEASAAEKKAAIEAVEREMMARHEGLMRGMMARGDMEATVKSAVMSMDGTPEEKKAALAKAMAALDKKYSARGAEGKLDHDDVIRVVDEALQCIAPSEADAASSDEAILQRSNSMSDSIGKAKVVALKVFGEDQPMWSDGVIDEAEFQAALDDVLKALTDVGEEEKQRVSEHAKFAFERERSAAMGDMLSKESMKKIVGSAVGGDEKLVNAAEMRFDQLQRDAEDGAVDEAVMAATMERALQQMGGAGEGERTMAQAFARKAAGWKSGQIDQAAAQQARAKSQIAQTLLKNQEMMADLTMSWEQKTEISAAESEENAKMLQKLGLAGLSEEEMKVTPSLRNLNQDPLMSDSLVYYLQSSETFIQAPSDDPIPDGVTVIQLDGGGMTMNHCSLEYEPGTTGGERGVTLKKGGGVCFVNGKQLQEDTVKLAHNDRLILGNSQAFRFVDPVVSAAEGGGGPKQLIDWDLAQTELNEAMGLAVSLKVDEEVAKKQAELDAQLKAMEEKFARENEALRKELDGKSDSAKIRVMDSRKAAIERFRMRSKAHVQEYKRELIRLEEQVTKVVPRVKEANTMAAQLGRCVKFQARLVTYVPESTIDDVLSPVEELYTQKQTSLGVLVSLHNPRSDMKRSWLWDPEPFYDRMAGMREMWKKWMLEQVMGSIHVKSDPFWTTPSTDRVGKAYMYLGSLTYQVEMAQWIPIVDFCGIKQGELRVILTPYESDFKTKLKPTSNSEAILGQKLFFVLRIEQARGLMEAANKNVFIKYTFSDDEGEHTTGVAQGKKFDPKFGEDHKYDITVTDNMLRYLQKDAICFEVFGEADDVDEDDIAEATQMELPPETFEFFMSCDICDADSGKETPFVEGLDTTNEKSAEQVGYELGQSTAHKIVLAIAQSDKNFKITKLNRAVLGNVRGLDGKVWDSAWTPCLISSQKRQSDNHPWIAEIEWNSFPAKLNAPDAIGVVFHVDFKCEVDEVERLALEEPLQLLKVLTFRVVAKGSAALVAVADAEQQKRFKRTAEMQEVYMGQWEVSNEAVNLAMTELREQSDEGSQDIMKLLDDDITRLQNIMIEEQRRQAEDLSTRLLANGIDVGNLVSLSVPDDLGGGGGDDKMQALMAQKNKAEEDAARALKEKVTLEQEVAALKARIKQLEGNSASATNATARIGQLQKQLKSQKNVAAGDGSKACIVS